jgi:hypothetical protein
VRQPAADENVCDTGWIHKVHGHVPSHMNSLEIDTQLPCTAASKADGLESVRVYGLRMHMQICLTQRRWIKVPHISRSSSQKQETCGAMLCFASCQLEHRSINAQPLAAKRVSLEIPQSAHARVHAFQLLAYISCLVSACCNPQQRFAYTFPGFKFQARSWLMSTALCDEACSTLFLYSLIL